MSLSWLKFLRSDPLRECREDAVFGHSAAIQYKCLRNIERLMSEKKKEKMKKSFKLVTHKKNQNWKFFENVRSRRRNQCDQIRRFFKKKLVTKVTQMIGNFLAILKNLTFM